METPLRSAYFSDEPLKMHTHYHDCHQILLILKGSIIVHVNGIAYTAGAGDIVIFSRYENHSVNILSKEYERYVLQISPFSGSTNRIYALLANRPEGFENILDVSDCMGEFTHLFGRITREAHSEARMGPEMLELLVNELLILIYRRTPTMSFSLEDDHFAYIFELQKRFETQYSHSYTLEDLAKEYNVSPSTLSHQFKKVTGTSVMDYLLSCRMASAKKYLTDTQMRIDEIVELCGFTDNSNFSRAFRKQNGMSPSEFRARYRA